MVIGFKDQQEEVETNHSNVISTIRVSRGQEEDPFNYYLGTYLIIENSVFESYNVDLYESREKIELIKRGMQVILLVAILV